jgi:colanic acid biosynthesis protein WcaH
MLDRHIFKTIVDSAPLVSIDILVRKNKQVLLGKRVNKPAQGCFFSIGGRVKKNETIKQALDRIAKDELGIKLKSTPKFIDIFEHFYDDSIFENVSTHYVNLAYEYKVDEIGGLPNEQHNEYKWFDVDELLQSDQVHKYVKDYFKR